MADEIERWSEELARDPTSGVFIPLADALRRRGQLDLAFRVAARGLARRPYDGDAHDLLARIWADRGDVERAMDEWSMALKCAPSHPGALKGMGFACYQVGRTSEAEQYLLEAVAADPDDASARSALARVRQQNQPRPSAPAVGSTRNGMRPSDARGQATALPPQEPVVPDEPPIPAPAARPRIDPRTAFVDVLEAEDQAALVVDCDGLVLAGSYVVVDGRDVAQEVGAALSGVSDEARRAMRHLALGAWSSLIFEAEAAIVGMAPLAGGGGEPAGEGRDSVAFVAVAPSVPLGLVRRLLARVEERARRWLGASDMGGSQ